MKVEVVLESVSGISVTVCAYLFWKQGAVGSTPTSPTVNGALT